MKNPWVTGAEELLRHGLEHMQSGTDFDKRIAMISIDNAVELMMKTYLGLPKRVTGFLIPRNKYQQISESFWGLLDALEEHAGDKIKDVDLPSIGHYHELRNQVYHQGNGITVETQKLEAYVELALILFNNLFEVSLGEVEVVVQSSPVSKFISRWTSLEQKLASLWDSIVGTSPPASTRVRVLILGHREAISREFQDTFQDIASFRNDLLHGQTTVPVAQIHAQTVALDSLLKELEREAS